MRYGLAVAGLGLAAVVVCGAPAPDSPGGTPRDAPEGDTGVTLARNAGATLVVLSLDPAAPGDNVVRVGLREPGGKPVAGTVRVALSLDGRAVSSATLRGAERRGALAIPASGRAALDVQVVDGPSRGARVTFDLDLPAEAPSLGFLEQVDRAMNELRSLRETQTLTSGSFEFVFRFEYQAPDRTRYTFVSPDGRFNETRIFGATRYDREPDGRWASSDLGFASPVPNFHYAERSYRVRLLGRERGERELLVVGLVQRTPSVDLHYRLWVDARDSIVRRYVMMAFGHYMTGSYTDFNAPVTIAAPP